MLTYGYNTTRKLFYYKKSGEFYKTTKHMNIIVTNNCNRNCPFCIAKKNSNTSNYKYIPLENIDKALNFAKKEDIKTIALSGGEPTLHPNILKIAKTINSNNYKLAIYTNFDFKDKVLALDGLVDFIFISYYGQEMPKPKDFKKSQIIITILLLKNHFKTIQDLDNFIEKYNDTAILLFSVPVNVNDYCEEQTVDFLEELDKQNMNQESLPDGTIIQKYKNCLVRRPDLPKAFIELDSYSFKMRLDGKISHFYSEGTEKLSEISNIDLRNELLSTHNPKERKAIFDKYKNMN